MEIEKHIKNLEEYCEVDNLFEKDGDFKEFCDNHIADIKAVIKDLKSKESDLYEANNRITDLLLILGDRDRIIDKMANEIYIEHNPHFNTVEDVKKYFEKELKNAKD